jgi:hypothetical protein
MTPTITTPYYAIEAGARDHFNRTKQSHELPSDFDIPAYKQIYIAAFNQALTAALAEMVKRGDDAWRGKQWSSFTGKVCAESYDETRKNIGAGDCLIITLQEPKA